MAKRILPHIVSNTPGSYTVLIMSRQNHYVRTFNHLDCGSDHLALSQAIKWRDRVLKLVRPSGKKRWTAPYKRKRQDGATSVDFNGVSRCVRQEKRANRTRYVVEYVATWQSATGKAKHSYFRVGELDQVTKAQEMHAEKSAKACRKFWQYCVDHGASFDPAPFKNWREEKLYPMTKARAGQMVKANNAQLDGPADSSFP